MKKTINKRYAVLVLMGFLIIGLSPQTKVFGKKHKAKLSVKYNKVMGDQAFLSINAKFKGDDGYEPATGLKLYVYREVDEDSIHPEGEITTDMEGKAIFEIKAANDEGEDIITHKYLVNIENNKKFKDASKAVKFLDSYLKAKVVEKDSSYSISASLTDANGDPIEGQKLQVRVQRLFAPLTIGKSSYKTDEDGNILVPIEDPLPGIDGVLTFEVVLDNRKYGVVKYIFDAPIGKQITDLSTFDERTMWSPPNKTPLFLWIFPNIIIFGIWLVIALLVRNLFKIYKS
ncbi:MAG: hypothetical protein GXO89_01655 [Chlorobi bacterium]|nr:hypothetical protein [Chlorobiota bacterium]